MVLHVVDASAPDEEQDRQREAVDDVLHEIGAGELPVELVLNKIDQVDPLGRRRLSNRFPAAPQVSALDRRGDGRSPGRARAAVRRSLGTRAAARSRTRTAAGCPSSTRSARPIEERKDTPDGVLDRRAAARAATCRASRRSWSPRQPGRAGSPPDRAADPEGAGGRRRAGARVLGGRRARPLGVRAGSSSRRASERSSPTGLAVAIPEGYAGLRPAALGARREARDLDRQHARARRLGLSRRAAGRTVNTDRARERSSSSRGCESRSSSILALPEVELVEVGELPESERGVRGFGSSYCTDGAAHPR